MAGGQRWKPEEDALLCKYVEECGSNNWTAVSEKMNGRDPRSCLQRWKNYLKPGVVRGPLTEAEQEIVLRMQRKHGNKWKRIAAEVPGRTAKRLGKWWEVYKEREHKSKQQQQLQENSTFTNGGPAGFCVASEESIDVMYDSNSVSSWPVCRPHLTTAELFPTAARRACEDDDDGEEAVGSVKQFDCSSSTPSVNLSLSPGQPDQPGQPGLTGLSGFSGQLKEGVGSGGEGGGGGGSGGGGGLGGGGGGGMVEQLPLLLRILEDLEESRQRWVKQKKKFRELKQEIEEERLRKLKMKMEETASKVKALREEEKIYLENVESDYRQHIFNLDRDAEIEDTEFVELWTLKHMKLAHHLCQQTSFAR